MFRLDRAVNRWRQELERGSSLSPREVDELEDHLRAHVDLDMELSPSLTPARAFAHATMVIGTPEKLSKEFARAGKPRWRKLVFAGWALFAVSFVLPAYTDHQMDGLFTLGTMPGWDAFFSALFWGDRLGQLSAVTNLVMLGSLLILRTSWRGRGRWLRWLVGGTGVLNLAYWPISTLTSGDPVSRLLPGYWVWAASFLCVAAGLWLRNREWASTTVTKEAA